MSYVVSSGITSTGVVLYLDIMTVLNGGVANSTAVKSYGSMYVSSGGTANSTTVNSRGSMYVYNGGVANSTTVNAYGDLYVAYGGTATAITALSGAYLGLTVASNTYIQGTSNGSAFEMKNAYISGYTVNSGGWMDVSSGGVANSTTVNSSGCMYGLCNEFSVKSQRVPVRSGT